ncbi:MAG: HIT domain-containing protein [Candidatus Kapabacteria bacterium]|nr:HIT domain-containing protein [Candidatus Kapabacteria bacterium]
MKNLWAPWRRQYVTQADADSASCFLCQAVEHDHVSQERGIVHIAEHSVIILNKYPYSSGHLLVAPKAHNGDLLDLDDITYACLMQSVRLASRAVTHVYKPHGLNIGMNLGSAAGAGVPDHCHVHVVPRWDGDTNFMPVVANVKVASEKLEDTWQRVTEAIGLNGQVGL